jgi:cytochrome c biogenesis protein CcdA
VNEVATLLREALSGGVFVALPLALAGGVLTGLNPCCLAIYPAAAGTCCAVGRAENSGSLSTSLAFVIGLSFTTAVLGVGAALAGTVLTGATGWTAYAIAAVPILMGLHVLGWLRLPMPHVVDLKRRGGLAGAFISGVAIWAVIVPCGTPVLAAMLSYTALDGSVVYSALLLFVYGFGAGLPVLLLGAAVVGLARRLEASGWRRRVEQATGGVLVAFGLYLVAVS